MDVFVRLVELGVPAVPERAALVLRTLEAPPRLIAHGAMVHAAALELRRGIVRGWPKVAIDWTAVMFGAAIHDIGKLAHPAELIGDGHAHEIAGPPLLERCGVAPAAARFARTHAWDGGAAPLEDLLVALADTCWKGACRPLLEEQLARQLVQSGAMDFWTALIAVDTLVETVAAAGPERLAIQALFMVN